MTRPILAVVMAEPLRRYFGPSLAALLPDVDVREDDGSNRAMEANFAIAVSPPAGRLAEMTRLKCVIAPGAGVDHILADPRYPRHIALARMSQPDLRQRMLEYVVLHVLRHHRRVLDYEAQQRARHWQILWPQKAAPERTVGLLGLGELGAPIAMALAALGFNVRGWARTPKTLAGVECFAGENDFHHFLDGCEILVNLLPSTPETEGILNGQAQPHQRRSRILRR